MAYNLKTRVLPDNRHAVKQIPIWFLNLDYFQEKLMTKFPKNAKSTILTPFCTLFEKNLFFFFFQFELSITVSNFNKKILSGFQAILVSDGRTDEQAWIWRTPRAKALGPKRENSNEREQRLFEFWQIVSLELNFPFNFHIQHFCWKTWGTSIQSFRYYTTDIKKCMEILYDNWLPWQCLKDSGMTYL